MGKLVMGYWDCPVCGRKEITGNVMNCPSCGRARGNVEFYMKGGAGQREENERSDVEYLTDEQTKAALATGDGPDWYCSFCNSLNHSGVGFCSSCGASRESSKENYFDLQRKKQEAEAAAAASAGSRPQAAPKKNPKALTIVIAVALVLIGVFFYLNGNKTQNDLRVTGLGWTRSVEVQANRQFSESGWSVPDGAEVTSQRQELHHYDQVLDHYESREQEYTERVFDHNETYYTYENKGNGTFEEVERSRPVYRTETRTRTVSVPVYRSVARYATKYYYNVWRWVAARTETASGTDHDAAWPDLQLADDEREGNSTELYTITVVDPKGVSATYSLAEDVWRTCDVDSTLNITSKRSGTDFWITDGKGEQIAPLKKIR